MKLTVTCGPPGSGKSTWSRERLYVLTADAMRMRGVDPVQVFRTLYSRLAKELAQRDCIFDSCALQAAARQRLLDIARAADATTELVVFTTPLDICKARNEARGDQSAQVDWRAMKMQMDALLVDILSEGWDVISYPCSDDRP